MTDDDKKGSVCSFFIPKLKYGYGWCWRQLKSNEVSKLKIILIKSQLIFIFDEIED